MYSIFTALSTSASTESPEHAVMKNYEREFISEELKTQVGNVFIAIKKAHQEVTFASKNTNVTSGNNGFFCGAALIAARPPRRSHFHRVRTRKTPEAKETGATVGLFFPQNSICPRRQKKAKANKREGCEARGRYPAFII